MINYLKYLFIIFVILIYSIDSFAFKEDHLINLMNKNECINCDLSGANLSNLKFERHFKEYGESKLLTNEINFVSYD